MQKLEGFLTKPNPIVITIDYIIRAARGKLHLPPLWLRDVGPSDFEATGREFLHLFIELAGLRPDEQLLEIGCGCGRMALPLSAYLNGQGRYIGMDITQPPIIWCQKNITPRHPNFQFQYIDVLNKRYNRQGKISAADYKFPFADRHFDFVFLTSVFTHLLPADTKNYLVEISRLLRPGGRAMMTFFLLNDVQRALAGQGSNDIQFKFGSGPYRTRNAAIPESAVAYEEDFLVNLLAESGLTLCKPVQYGRWSGRPDGLSYQDIIVVSLI